jgi:putative phosphonate metabolism protein
MSGARYALYFAPEEGSALARFGWGWLGRAPESPELLPLPAHRAALVAEPRRYGFHGTLKPPFRLAEGTSRDELVKAAQAFAGRQRPFVEPPCVLAELHGFLALRPSLPSLSIAALADDCVRQFDRFRAPAGAEERRKRLAAPLTERQRGYVEAWGYPYVFEEFRLHLTLTCRLDDAARAACRAVLEPLAAEALAEPLVFRSLCLFEQAGTDAPFVLAARFPFAG